MSIVHGWKEVGGRRMVDVELHDAVTTPSVFWSPSWKNANGARGGFNSYVLAENPNGDFFTESKGVSLLSVNGMGEVRWEISLREIQNDLQNERETWWKHDENGERLKVVRHFGLVPHSLVTR